MRVIPLLAVLAACSGTDTTLTNGNSDVDTVVGNGVMEIDKTEVLIDGLVVDFAQSDSFTITSAGEANLLIYEIRIIADATQSFYFEEVEDIELAPGQTRTENVTCTLTSDAPVDGILRIRTNDPDKASFELPIIGWPEGYTGDTDTGTTGDTGV